MGHFTLANLETFVLKATAALKSLHAGPKSERYQRAARAFARVLSCDSAAIFVPDPDSPESFILLEWWGRWRDRFQSLEDEIVDTAASMPSLAKRKPFITDLTASARRRSSTYLSGESHASLLDDCEAVMEIPLCDRNKNTLAVIRVYSSNKSHFSRARTLTAQLLAYQALVVLKFARTIDLIGWTTEHVVNNRSELSKELATQCRDILQCERVVIYQVDAHSDVLSPEAVVSPQSPPLDDDILAAIYSAASRLWKNDSLEEEVQEGATTAVLRVLGDDTDYLGTIAAVSLSEKPFDSFDRQVLAILATQAATMWRLVRRKRLFEDTFENVVTKPLPHESTLNAILDSTNRTFHFKNSLLYWKNADDNTLEARAYRGEHPVTGYEDISFPLNDSKPSIAMHVFQHGPYYTDSAKTSDVAWDEGVAKFQLGAVPLAGIQLKVGDDVVGVLLTWGEGVSEKHVNELEAFAILAAGTIAFSHRERHRSAVAAVVQDILESTGTTESPYATYDSVMEGALAAGFARARIFDLNDDRTAFVLKSRSIGQADTPVEVSLETNPYAAHTFSDFANRKARIYDPRKEREALPHTICLGPDPDAEAVGKLPNHPWAVVPLVSNGQIHGQLVAENAPDVDIEAEQLSSLELLASAAVLAYTNSNLIGRLQAGQIQPAYEMFLEIDTEVSNQPGHVTDTDYVERMLEWIMLASVSPVALGASRVAYFTRRGSTFVSKVAVGACTETAYDEMRLRYRVLPNQWQSPLLDPGDYIKIDNELTLPEDIAERACKNTVTVPLAGSMGAGALGKLNGCNEAIVSPLRFGSRLVGLLLVDYSWRVDDAGNGIGIRDNDLSTVNAFCNQAARLLSHARRRSLGYLTAVLNAKALRHIEVSDDLPSRFREIEKDGEVEAFVLACDLRRSTHIMRQALNQKAYWQFFQELYNTWCKTIHENFGIVDDFTGDGLIAWFPELYSGPNAGLYALKAADALHKDFRAVLESGAPSFQLFPEDAGIGVGIDFGTPFVLRMMNRLKIVGDALVYAVRMGAAPAGCTYLNQQAYTQIEPLLHKMTYPPPVSIEATTIDVKNEGLFRAYKTALVGDVAVDAPGWAQDLDKKEGEGEV